MSNVIEGAVAAMRAPGSASQGFGRLARPFRRLVGALSDRGESGAARRLASGAFLMRVVNAGIGFATQIFLARWMGEAEYGVYAYVWVWLLFAGGVGSIGLPVAALKFVPDYTAKGDLPGLRGFLQMARWRGLLPSIVASALAGIALAALPGATVSVYIPVALIALVILPIYVLTDVQTGIARAYDDADLGLAADYLVRPLLLLAFAGALFGTGQPGTAAAIMGATLAAVALTALLQGVVLSGRLARRVPAGPARNDRSRWAALAVPLLAVSTFTLLLGSTDILLLKLFVGPEEIARYYAATKIVAIASFVSYGVAATSSHRFAAAAAAGDREALARVAVEAARWSFWPTLVIALALALLAQPLLWLFGPGFGSAAPIVGLLGLGLVAAAAVGPADRALAMTDGAAACASIYAVAFMLNVLFCLVLVPLLGPAGAAAGTGLALAAKSAMLWAVARRRLGLDTFVLTAGLVERRASSRDGSADALSVEIATPAEAAREEGPWRSLASRSLEPNAFYAHAFATAGLAHLPEGEGARVLLAWRGLGQDRRLVGLLPVCRARGRVLNPFAVRRACEFLVTLSTPLVDPDRPAETLDAMLAALKAGGVHALALPYLAEGQPVAAALADACRTGGRVIHPLGGHRRAMLRSPMGGAEYVRATLETRRRKEADRQRRRLADTGALGFAMAHEPDEVGAALDAFLALERAGWKGQAGTDMGSAPGALSFIRDSAIGLSRDGAFRVATLTLDGRPIASGLVAVAGRRAFYLKTTYDEDLARFSPGLLLTLDLTAALLDDPAIDDADSIAVADHPMIDRVWTERFDVASVMVSTGRPAALFRLAVAAEGWRGTIRLKSKPVREKFSGIWRRSGKVNVKQGGQD